MFGVTVDLNITCDASILTVSYSLENHSGADLGLFNRIAGINLDGGTNYDPANVYIDVAEEVLVLRKAPLVIPKELSAGGVKLPAVMLLSRGQTFAERFALPVPVAVREPMRRALLSSKAAGAEVVADRLVYARQVQLTLGVFTSGPDLHYREVSAAPGVLAVWPPGIAEARQELITCTEVLRTPLAVLDYRVVSAD